MDRVYYQQSRPEMVQFIPPRRKRVLEIGCAEGRFVAGIAGIEEAWGVEPDPVAAEIAEDRLFRVLVGRFEDIRTELPIGYFDVVICNDVIEHMDDHDRF